jgi:hypothetical protein
VKLLSTVAVGGRSSSAGPATPGSFAGSGGCCCGGACGCGG